MVRGGGSCVQAAAVIKNPCVSQSRKPMGGIDKCPMSARGDVNWLGVRIRCVSATAQLHSVIGGSDSLFLM